MSNKRRRARKLNPNPRLRSCQLTTGEGARPYDEETIAHLHRLVPGVNFIVPNAGEQEETDEDRLRRARSYAGALRAPYAAVIRNDALGTRYFREVAIGHATELHFMYHSPRSEGRDQACPYNTVIVVFAPADERKRLENGIGYMFFEPAPAKENRA